MGRGMDEYLSAKYNNGKLDNTVIDITHQDIYDLYDMNIKDKKECDEITQSSYPNENYYDHGDDN